MLHPSWADDRMDDEGLPLAGVSTPDWFHQGTRVLHVASKAEAQLACWQQRQEREGWGREGGFMARWRALGQNRDQTAMHLYLP